ncbi:MAG: ACT domain-containing protein [Micromonosporaceae bacterium]
MLLQVRVRLPDRPGSLGRVTWLLGALGVDIQQVMVLGRESGRAVDDFTVELPGSVGQERLITTLQDVPGVVVDGVWPAAVPGASSDVGVLGQIAADPGRGFATLVDAVPRLLGAEWAALVTTDGAVAYASVGAPGEVPVSEPVRPRAYDIEDQRYAMTPLREGQVVMVVARTGAPAFHVGELDRLIQLVDAAAAVLSSAALDAAPALAARAGD